MAVAWEDRGILLSVRRHGESDAIVTLLTETHGRHAGVVKGGGGRRAAGVLQQGNLVKASWRARLDAHLGTVTCEVLRGFAAESLADASRLAGLTALCAMADATLAEREAHGPIFSQALQLLDHLGAPEWSAAYALWELSLLRELGFGLDLAACVATGVTEDLTHVSPRSGRAVSRTAAAPYIDKLFALPDFMRAGDASLAQAGDVAAALALTQHFFETHVFRPHRQKLPAARVRFAERIGG